ncbi:hypothetical protein MHBO_003178 [Bonamia ostreae]|uniref:peptide-methionine (S)-S-oxide reductase n=1 Tax=Bonamia ostreae TaxID=126728 RepID=A0ABV2APR0_9EUKA
MRQRSITNQKVVFDSEVVSFAELCELFFELHDPTTLNRQKNDIGSQYRSIAFYRNKEQKTEIKGIIEKISKSYRKPVVTEVKKMNKFWLAEDYHQKYLEKKGQSAKKGEDTCIKCYG